MPNGSAYGTWHAAAAAPDRAGGAAGPSSRGAQPTSLLLQRRGGTGANAGLGPGQGGGGASGGGGAGPGWRLQPDFQAQLRLAVCNGCVPRATYTRVCGWVCLCVGGARGRATGGLARPSRFVALLRRQIT
jgi:hypothetical protein